MFLFDFIVTVIFFVILWIRLPKAHNNEDDSNNIKNYNNNIDSINTINNNIANIINNNDSCKFLMLLYSFG